jgi:hypothetical protein
MADRDFNIELPVEQQWTNADAVDAFVEAHQRFSPGDNFVLPDADQQYTVIRVGTYRSKHKVTPYLELEAPCALCGEMFAFTKDVMELRTSRHVVRTCSEHRRGWQTPVSGAWLTSSEHMRRAIHERAMKDAKESGALQAAEERKGVKRRGRMERHVLDVAALVECVRDTMPIAELVEMAAGFLPAPEAGQRDTRRQVVTRAVHSLCREKDGPLRMKGLVVLFS